MKGTIRILRRFIGATIIISIFLLVLNFILLGVWFFKGMNEGQSPDSTVKGIAGGLHKEGSTYSVNAEAQKLLEQSHAWSMLLDGSGSVVWSHDLPQELPLAYSLVDVAKFSRSYLKDYPVFVWEHDNGLLVIGYPTNSIGKYQFNFPIGWVSNLPFRSLALLVGNICLAVLLSILIGSLLIKSIKPLISGIHSLSEEQPVNIEPNGILRDLADSVNRTSELLQKKNAALKTRDEARYNWIAGISHDIRTPLSMVLGYSSSLEENEALPAEQQRQAGIIRQQGEKLRSLVSDLNLVSMLEYEMQPTSLKPVRLSALARQAATEFLNNGLDDKFALELDIQDETIKVNGDEKLLLRAVTNLVQNSINHNPEGCQILLRVAAEPGGKACRFIVSDNGRGVPESLLPDLTELPYSSKRKTPVQSGHGLGLPMVARIAVTHHGRLVLTSEAGKGFCAEMVLPAAAAVI